MSKKSELVIIRRDEKGQARIYPRDDLLSPPTTGLPAVVEHHTITLPSDEWEDGTIAYYRLPMEVLARSWHVQITGWRVVNYNVDCQIDFYLVPKDVWAHYLSFI